MPTAKKLTENRAMMINILPLIFTVSSLSRSCCQDLKKINQRGHSLNYRKMTNLIVYIVYAHQLVVYINLID